MNMVDWALRSVLLYYELYKKHGRYREATKALPRMIMDDDLKFALFFEQAAYCYTKLKIPLIRKYAFYLVLAGKKYAKCGKVLFVIKQV